MNNWSTTICEANGIHIHYLRTGGNKPPLVLLHGLMTNGACWTPVARVLAEEYDVIMPDSRGHGMSSVPDSGYRYEDLANDVVSLIKTLRLSLPILIGHSMGGMTAAVVASLQPHLISGVILADPTFLSPKVQQEVYESDVAGQHRRILDQPLDKVLKDAQMRNPHRSLELLELLAKARFQTSMSAFDVLTPPNPDFKQLIRAIDIPILLVIGDNGIVSTAVAEELKFLNSELQVQLIQEAGHGLHYDQPEQFAAVVKAFLGRSI